MANNFSRLIEGEHFVLPQVSEVDTPTLSFGNGKSGMFSHRENYIKIATGGANCVTFNDNQEAKFTSAMTPTGGIAAAGGFSTAATGVHTGGKPAASATDGTDSAMGASTEVNACECFVPTNMTATGISILNGPTVGTDKYCLILYDSAGAVIANTATAGTTSSGPDAYQRIAFTSPASLVGPATYHIAVTMNGTTDNHHTHAFGDFACGTHTGHTFGTPASITPDTTFTAGDGPIASLY